MPRQPALANIVLVAFGIVYPAAVFFLRGTVEASLFIVMALIIVAVRLALGKFDVDGWRPALALTAGDWSDWQWSTPRSQRAPIPF